ncbi:MAG: ribosome small subunit-dependent GTPase A [Alcanivoracaceae bacterium]|nr:ribosome small subunit-dependent GTPase A [Alcanivoracaceae bacterium]
MNDALLKLGLVPFFTQQLTEPSVLQERLGRVMAVHRSKYSVACGAGERVVELSPSLRQLDSIDRPTVGDWVVLDESLLRVERVLERKSLFKRLGAGASSSLQPIAANVDTLFIVTSCNEEFKESRLERYLALCEDAGASPVIVLTKADLIDDVDSYIHRARAVRAGVPVEAINARDPERLSDLRAWVDNTSTIALVGSSGVGKSTILNALAGHSLAATGEIREDDKKGRHTTTHRELHVLPSGGLLIDVPGMRELRVAEIESSIDAVFDDVGRLAVNCRFVDCKHEAEPGCEVIRAVQEGRLDSRRLSNYKKLLRENALATTTLAEKRAQQRGFAKMVREAKDGKRKKGEP